MRVSVVFDASAAIAYARGSLAIGEILSEIMDAVADGEQVCAVLPAASLLQAAGDQVELVDRVRLAAHPAVRLVSTRHDHAGPAVRIAHGLKVPAEVAAALYLALSDGASLLTGHAGRLRDYGVPEVADRVIDIADEHG